MVRVAKETVLDTLFKSAQKIGATFDVVASLFLMLQVGAAGLQFAPLNGSNILLRLFVWVLFLGTAITVVILGPWIEHHSHGKILLVLLPAAVFAAMIVIGNIVVVTHFNLSLLTIAAWFQFIAAVVILLTAIIASFATIQRGAVVVDVVTTVFMTIAVGLIGITFYPLSGGAGHIIGQLLSWLLMIIAVFVTMAALFVEHHKVDKFLLLPIFDAVALFFYLYAGDVGWVHHFSFTGTSAWATIDVLAVATVLVATFFLDK